MPGDDEVAGGAASGVEGEEGGARRIPSVDAGIRLEGRHGPEPEKQNEAKREKKKRQKEKKKDRKTLETLERETMRKEGGAGAEEEGVPVGRKQELGIRLSLSDAKFPFKLPRQVVPDR